MVLMRLKQKLAVLQLIICLFMILIIINQLQQPKRQSNNKGTIMTGKSCMRDPIDAVYTWVNGSDPDYQALKLKYSHIEEVGDGNLQRRFNDWGTLKYSIRSLGMFAPWIRNIYVVTNGQIPDWLKVADGMKVITHEEIFESKEHLPTFNPDAIELYLHRIPGLSDKFLYINDDMFIGNNLHKEDLCHGENGQKIYHSEEKVNLCAEGCPYHWLGDGKCQEVCNNSLCLHDKGDCSMNGIKLNANQAFEPYDPDSWYQNTNRWNIIFNRDFGFAVRYYPMPQANLLDKHVKEAFNLKYRDEILVAARHKFRHIKGPDIWFTYTNFLMETRKKINEKTAEENGTEIEKRYDFELRSEEEYASLVSIVNDENDTLNRLEEHYYGWNVGWFQKKLPIFLCYNDYTQDPPNPERLREVVADFLEGVFYVKSKFEI